MTALAGLRVLITRPRDDAGRLQSLLEAAGATVVFLPTISIEPPEDTGPLDIALRDLERFDWIVFASRNAARSVFDRLAALDLPVSFPPRLRVAAVGPATAAELAARGVSVTCMPGEATAAALATAMERSGIRGTAVLLPSGDRARPELRNRLQSAGAAVTVAPAYRTVPPTEIDRASLGHLQEGTIDVVALASPSAALNLAAMLEPDLAPLRQVRLVCIGPTTAQAVRDLGLEPAAVAPSHTAEGLVEAIAALHPLENRR